MVLDSLLNEVLPMRAACVNSTRQPFHVATVELRSDLDRQVVV